MTLSEYIHFTELVSEYLKRKNNDTHNYTEKIQSRASSSTCNDTSHCHLPAKNSSAKTAMILSSTFMYQVLQKRSGNSKKAK